MSASSSSHVQEQVPSSSGTQTPADEPSQSHSFQGLFGALVTDPSGNTMDAYVAVSSDLYIQTFMGEGTPPSSVLDFKGSNKTAKTVVRISLDRLPDDAEQEDVHKVISEVQYTNLTCLRVQDRGEKSKGLCVRLNKKRRCEPAYYYIKLHKPEERKQLLSFLKIALLPLALLQSAIEKLTEALPSSESAHPTHDVDIKCVDKHEEQREFADSLIKIATDAGNAITNMGNVGKAATKFAVTNEMVKELADVFTGIELLGPLFFTISLITRGIGAVLRLKANRQALPQLHQRLKYYARECAGILCRAMHVGGLRVEKALLSNMMGTLTNCWGVAQSTERLVLSSGRGLLINDKGVQEVLQGMDKIDMQLRLLHVFDFSQNAVYMQQLRDADQDRKIEAVTSMVESIGGQCHDDGDKFEECRTSVPSVDCAEMIVREALPKLQELKQAVLGNEIVALTGQGRSGYSQKAFVEGHGGVGKSTACIAICHDEEVKARFRDGMHYMEFSLEAEDEEIVQLLCRAMRHAGRRKFAQETLTNYRNEKDSRDAVEDVVQAVRKCFEGKNVLFVLDNVSFRKRRNGQATQEWPDVLCAIVEDAPRAQILFSSRYANLTRPRFRSVQFGVLRMDNKYELEAAKLLVERYAQDSRDARPLSSDDKRARDELVIICDGLQLCLCVVGLMVRTNMGRWTDVLQNVRRSSLVSDGVSDAKFHPGLRAVMKASLEMLDGEDVDMCRMQDLTRSVLRNRCGRSFESMYASFCVLRSARCVPSYLWRPLFGVETEEEAKAVAQFFEGLGLAEIETKQDKSEILVLHDMQHEYARVLGNEGMSVAWHHRRFIQEYALIYYGRDADCVEWSEVCEGTSEHEQYMAENLMYHLANGAYSFVNPEFMSVDKEAENLRKVIVSILTNFKWIRGRAFSSGRSAILSDYRLALTDEAIDTIAKGRKVENVGRDSRAQQAMVNSGEMEKVDLRRRDVVVLDAIYRALSDISVRSFGHWRLACAIHEKEGALLATELLGRIALIGFEGNDLASVQHMKDVLEGLSGSVKGSVKGPLVVPVVGANQNRFTVCKKSSATYQIPCSNRSSFAFVQGTKYLIKFFAGIFVDSLTVYESNSCYREVFKFEGNSLLGYISMIGIECCPFEHNHFIVIAQRSGDLFLRFFLDGDTGPTMQDQKRLLPGASNDASNGMLLPISYQCADANEGVNVLAAIRSGWVWVWRKEDTSYCAMDAECKYKVSKPWTSKARVPLTWVKVTPNGTRVLCGTGRNFDTVDSAPQDVAFVLRVACDTDGSPVLQLEHTLELRGSVNCAPVIARDSRKAYIAVGCDVELADLVTGRMASSKAGWLNTNSIEGISLWEDDKERVPQILVVARPMGKLECWSMKSSGCAQKEKEITIQDAGVIDQKSLVLVRRKRCKNEARSITLEIAVKICGDGGEGVVQVFDVAVGGQYSGSCSKSAMSTIPDAQKGKGSEYIMRAVSLSDYLAWQELNLRGVLSILRHSSIFVLVAARRSLVLIDACTGKIIDEARNDDDDDFEVMDASPNGDFVCVGTREGRLHQWKVTEDNSGRPRLMFCLKECLHPPGAIELIIYCRNGLVGAVDSRKRVIVWYTGVQTLRIFGQRLGGHWSRVFVWDASNQKFQRHLRSPWNRIMYLQSRDGCLEFFALYDKYNSKHMLYKLGKEKLVCENKFRDYGVTLSAGIERACLNLKPVREVARKAARGTYQHVYSCAYPVHEEISIEKSYIKFPRKMTKCGCAPVVATDYTQFHGSSGEFLYNVLTFQDPERPFSVIAGAVFFELKLASASVFHFYENP